MQIASEIMRGCRSKPVARESSGDGKGRTHVSWLNQRLIQQPAIICTEELQRDLQRGFGKSPNLLIQRAWSQTEKTFCWQRDVKKAVTLSPGRRELVLAS